MDGYTQVMYSENKDAVLRILKTAISVPDTKGSP